MKQAPVCTSVKQTAVTMSLAIDTTVHNNPPIIRGESIKFSGKSADSPTYAPIATPLAANWVHKFNNFFECGEIQRFILHMVNAQIKREFLLDSGTTDGCLVRCFSHPFGYVTL